MGWREQANGNLRDGNHPNGGTPAATVHEGDFLDNQNAMMSAFELRRRLDTARAGRAGDQQRDVEQAMAERQEFWVDTCRDLVGRRTGYKQVLELYQRYGCRFCEPTHSEVQGILDALDSALPFWDRDHPELFYQTLELNFGELVRHG
jgi:hypothetical protein